MTPKISQQPTVFIVDDDPAIRFAMQALMDSVNISHEIYSSGDEFLENVDDQRPGCLVLDIRMPGLGGLELQEELLRRGSTIPIIFITGHGDIPMAVEAMKQGAIDFIRKPFRHQELLDRINEALTAEATGRAEKQNIDAIRQCFGDLTPRESEVFGRVSAGQANKVIAIELGISERTVEIHRSQVMRKMKARTLADLVRMRITLDREGPE